MTLARPSRLLPGAMAAITALFAVACSSSAGSQATSTSKSVSTKPEKAHISVARCPLLTPPTCSSPLEMVISARLA